jgi:hypothetical protein
MPTSQTQVKILVGRAIVQFAPLITSSTQSSPTLLPAFDPENVQHLLTRIEEPVNGWKTYTHTFRARNRDYIDSLLEPFLKSRAPAAPMMSMRFGVVSGNSANWRQWEDQIYLGHGITVGADPKSGPTVTIRTADRLWLLHADKVARANRGLASSIMESFWLKIGGGNSLIEPTVLIGHTQNTGVWYQASESNWSFILRTLLPIARNSDGTSGYRIYVRDNTLHFHSPSYKVETPKRILYSVGAPGFFGLSIEDRFIESAGGKGAAGIRRIVYDPLNGTEQLIQSDSSKLIKFADSRPEYVNWNYEFSHVGNNLLSAEVAGNQQKFSALSSEVFSASFSAATCLDIRVGDIVDLSLTASLSELSIYSGLWLVNKAVHTINAGALSSTYLISRGEFNLPTDKTITGPEEFSASTSAAGIAVNTDSEPQIPSGQRLAIKDDGVLVPIQDV